MDITLWSNNINSINVSQQIKDTIILFFTNFKSNNSLDFIEIKENMILKALNNINNYKSILICMDAEFQSSISNMKYIKELGSLFFIRDKFGIFYYIGSIFVNFNSIVEYNIDISNLRPLYSTYCTVTPETLKEMEVNEKVFKLENIIEPLEDKNLFKTQKKYIQKVDSILLELNNNYIYKYVLNEHSKNSINTNFDYLKKAETYNDVLKEINYIKRKLMKLKFDIYGVHLQNTDLYINFLKTHELYWSDTLVKERVKLMSDKNLFFELFTKISENTLFVVKGIQDFVAFNNTVNLLKHDTLPNFDNSYDIETFNGLSNYLYASSQLENTYKNIIKTKVYKKFAKKIFDSIIKTIGNKAHNPVVDSLFTIIVAVTINIGLNEYFEKQ